MATTSPTVDAPAPGTNAIAAPLPEPIEQRVLRRTAADVRREFAVRRRGRLPAGSLGPSVSNTRRALADPLALLLEHYRDYGPVFTIRVLHEPFVFVLGAEGTHQLLVSEADAFSWREGRYRDMSSLLGDGMLNIDGRYHHELRHMLLPAFHRTQVAEASSTMVAEAVQAVDRLNPGQHLDVYAWTRELALRIALRALVGIEAGAGREPELADAFDRALRFYGRHFFLQTLRGPATPHATAMRATAELDRLVYDEIRARRASGDHGPGVLGMLMGATTEHGDPLPDAAVRDQVVTLLFAGHDTTTATIAFMLHELARHPGARAALATELSDVLGGAPPAAADITGERLPVLERTIKETMRRYPPAWIGPRRTVRDVTIAGTPLPSGLGVHYSSWATHHLPDLWADPLAFDPDRFRPDREAAIPKGAYVPFGGGSRMCLGKRFGEFEIRALAAVMLQRFHFELDPTVPLRIATTPTLGPANGLWFTTQPTEVSR